jgi:hypothetical protein
MAKKTTEKKIEDLKLPQVDVLKLSNTKGLPEAGASVGYNSCSTVSQ